MILLCYDGSADALSAVDRAGEIFAGQSAVVLTVWEPLRDVIGRSSAGFGFGFEAGMVDFEAVDAASEKTARERAAEGVERAGRAGLNPDPRTTVRATTIADALLAQAGEVDATVIVLGSRGLTGLKSLLLGSVSQAVLQHADRPVMVIPSPEIASERAAKRH